MCWVSHIHRGGIWIYVMCYIGFSGGYYTVKMVAKEEREAGDIFQFCERPILRTRIEQIAFKWFMLRFPNRYFDASYFAEWVSRFESGEPWLYMDQESLDIYKGIMGKRSA